MKNSHSPLFSIIISSYNRKDQLLRCLDSVFKQTYKNYEIIVCDDYSTDGTKTELKKIKSSKLKVFYTKKNFGGPARPRNICIKKAKGKYLAFLDSDDVWFPKKLETVKKALNNNPDFCYHPLEVRSLQKNQKYFWNKKTGYKKLKKPLFNSLIRNGNRIANSSVVVRTSILKKAGLFSESKNMIAAEDFDMWLRIARFTDNFIFINKCLGIYEISSDNISTHHQFIKNCFILSKKYKKEINENEPAWFYFNLGYAYYKVIRFHEAIQCFKNVINLGSSILYKARALSLILFLKCKMLVVRR